MNEEDIVSMILARFYGEEAGSDYICRLSQIIISDLVCEYDNSEALVFSDPDFLKEQMIDVIALVIKNRCGGVNALYFGLMEMARALETGCANKVVDVLYKLPRRV